MTTLLNMDKNRSYMTERILDFTLEIIYLLTGKNHKIVRERSEELLMPRSHLHGPSPITESPPHSLTPERNKKEILEVIHKMMELLTGEVPIRCQDVTIYFSMEEWQYVEGHKDLYKDTMMENQPPLTSPDGSSNTNSPESCTGPLYSQECLQEDHTIPHHYQEEEQIVIKVEQEEYMRWDQQPMEEDNIIGAIKLEETCLLISKDGQNMWSPWEGRLISPPEDAAEDNGVKQCSPGGNPITGYTHHRDHSATRATHPCNPGEYYDTPDIITRSINSTTHTEDKANSHSSDYCFSCSVCGKSFISKKILLSHQKIHTGEQPFSCSECGKSFKHKVSAQRHQRCHTGERPFSCSECGKSFKHKHNLQLHQACHTGEKPFSCSECGKRFSLKGGLVRHQKTHTGEWPLSSLECGESLNHKQRLQLYQHCQTGEWLFSCSECGKSFTHKKSFQRHHRCHTGERPYSCSECGNCFKHKHNLQRHQQCHIDEQPFSCSECGKSFKHKGSFQRHQRCHTDEQPFSCLECGKYFKHKVSFERHQRCHTGERPFSCLLCEKSFKHKHNLQLHQRCHTG